MSPSGATRVVAAALCLTLPHLALGAASTSDDRITVSAQGGTLTGTDGGGGGSLGWLHNFNADSVVGIAAEHQVLADSRWTFGSLSGAVTLGQGDARYSLYGEVHEGAGDEASRAFHYSIVAAGVIGTYFHRLSVQLDDRRIDIDTTHGNLPKIGFSYVWSPHVSTAVSYSDSVSGNLGTQLGTVRIDLFSAPANFFAGGSFGQAAPAVLNIQTNILTPGRTLHEGYVGVSKQFRPLRGELTLVADYLNLSGSKRATVTLNYIFHVGHAGGAR